MPALLSYLLHYLLARASFDLLVANGIGPLVAFALVAASWWALRRRRR